MAPRNSSSIPRVRKRVTIFKYTVPFSVFSEKFHFRACTNRDKLDRILNKQSSLVFHSFHKSSKLSHPFPEETRSAYLPNARMRKLLSPFREDSSSISTNNRKVQSSWRVEKKLYNFFIISRLKLLRIRLEIRSWNFSKDIKKEKKNRRKKILRARESKRWRHCRGLARLGSSVIHPSKSVPRPCLYTAHGITIKRGENPRHWEEDTAQFIEFREGRGE